MYLFLLHTYLFSLNNNTRRIQIWFQACFMVSSMIMKGKKRANSTPMTTKWEMHALNSRTIKWMKRETGNKWQVSLPRVLRVLHSLFIFILDQDHLTWNKRRDNERDRQTERKKGKTITRSSWVWSSSFLGSSYFIISRKKCRKKNRQSDDQSPHNSFSLYHYRFQ